MESRRFMIKGLQLPIKAYESGNLCFFKTYANAKPNSLAKKMQELHLSYSRLPSPLKHHLRLSSLRTRRVSRSLHLGQLARLSARLPGVDRLGDHDSLHAVLRLGSVVGCVSGLRLLDDFPVWATRFALPAGLEKLAHLEAREGVGFGVEDDVGEREDVVRGEEEVEVFQRLSL